MKHTITTIGCLLLLGLQAVCAQSRSENSQDSLSWLEYFPDTHLQALMDSALAANSDIRTARLALEQSEAKLRSAKLAYLPSFALNPSGTYSKTGDAASSLSYNLPLNMNWELNFAGKQKFEKEAAASKMLQSGEELRAVQIQILASVANTYYTLVMLDRQLEITKESVRNQEESLETVKALKEAGEENEIAVNQTEAQFMATRNSVKDIELQISKTETSLSLLANRTPDRIERSSWEDVEGINLDPSMQVSLESLSSRPDVLAAEYAMRAAFSNEKVARSEFYPSLSISGSAGWTNNIGEVVNPAQFLINAIGSLAQPLFRKGTLRANLKVAQAQREQARISFEKALLTAGGEVRDALAECKISKAKEAARTLQLEASRNAWKNSSTMMQYSSVTYLEVLTAQSSYLSAQLSQVADWLEYQQGLVNLYKAVCP